LDSKSTVGVRLSVENMSVSVETRGGDVEGVGEGGKGREGGGERKKGGMKGKDATGGEDELVVPMHSRVNVSPKL